MTAELSRPHNPAASRWAAFAVIWLALLAAGRERMLHDPGTYWHTVVGESILSSGALPQHDQFSFTFFGRPWIAQQWLGECAMAVLHAIGGLDALLVAAAALLAWTFSGLFARWRRGGLSAMASIVLVVLVIAASSHHFHPRPHLITLALMAWLMGLLCDVDAGRLPPRWLYVLPAVFIVWANVHGGALGGLATLLLVVAGWLVRPGARRRIGAATMLNAAALSVLAMLVNPYGAALPYEWLVLMDSPVLPRLISEHGPLSLLHVDGWMTVALMATYLAALFAAGIRSWRVSWLAPLAWLLLAWSRVRHGPIFAVTAAVVMAEAIPIAWQRRRGALTALTAPAHVFGVPRENQSPDRKGGVTLQLRGPYETSEIDSPPLATLRVQRTLITGARSPFETARAGAGAAALVAVALLVQAAGWRVPLIGAGWAKESPAYWPLQTARTLNAATRDSPRDVRVFNEMRFGGYLIYHVPRAKLFIDDRCELYGDAFLLNYASLFRRPAQGAEALDAWRVEYALVRPTSSLAKFLGRDPTWFIAAQDPASILFQRADSNRVAAAARPRP